MFLHGNIGCSDNVIMKFCDMTMKYDYEISLFGHRRKKTNTKVS